MAVDNFRPEIWAAAILEPLRAKLVYAGAGVVNREYEGEIKRAGDTVHITAITDPTIRSYTEHGTITWEELADDNRDLLIDQADYFAFKVDDIERAQSLPGFIESASRAAAYGLAEETDAYVSSVMYAAVNGTSNDVGSVTADISDNTAFGGVFVALRSKLARSNVPAAGRWAVIPPELTGALLQDARFVNASQSGDGGQALREGLLGRIVGFDVYEANTVPTETVGVYSVIAGHPMATTYADQINETEAIRLENQFGDGIRGLHTYGAKVIHPEALALASVTVQA